MAAPLFVPTFLAVVALELPKLINAIIIHDHWERNHIQWYMGGEWEAGFIYVHVVSAL